MSMKIYAAIQIGEGKAAKEKVCDDRILVDGRILEDGYVEISVEMDAFSVAVADGVGGTGCGWKAATVALENLAMWDCATIEDEYDLEDVFAKVDACVRTVAMESDAYMGTASTLSGMIVKDRAVALLHVGDSRIYQLRNVQGHTILKQLTEDQNNLRKWKLEEEKNGRTFSEAEMKEAFGWNHITSYVGMKSEREFRENMVVEDYAPAEGVYIITSDGIHDFIDKKTFRKILEGTDAWKEKIYEIMQEARENGSQDDQSIIVVDSTN